jgi:hypothetical protein
MLEKNVPNIYRYLFQCRIYWYFSKHTHNSQNFPGSEGVKRWDTDTSQPSDRSDSGPGPPWSFLRDLVSPSEVDYDVQSGQKHAQRGGLLLVERSPKLYKSPGCSAFKLSTFTDNNSFRSDISSRYLLVSSLLFCQFLDNFVGLRI